MHATIMKNINTHIINLSLLLQQAPHIEHQNQA